MSASIDNITINFSDDIDNITIGFLDSVDNIEIDYLSDIDDITLNLGQAFIIAGVSTVNGQSGDVSLTSSAVLSVTTTSSGFYDHLFFHDLNDQNVLVSVFTPDNQLVISDVINEDPNYVNIKAAIDLTGYKAVAQR